MKLEYIATKCDICQTLDATVDGKTQMGPWASMCDMCHCLFGRGFGPGKGQKLKIMTLKNEEKVI